MGKTNVQWEKKLCHYTEKCGFPTYEWKAWTTTRKFDY